MEMVFQETVGISFCNMKNMFSIALQKKLIVFFFPKQVLPVDAPIENMIKMLAAKWFSVFFHSCVVWQYNDNAGRVLNPASVLLR